MVKTIRGKLLVPILSIVLIGGLGMGYASYKAASDAVTDATRNDGLRSVQALRQLIDLVMDTAQLDLSGIATDPALKQLLQDQGSKAENQGSLESQMKELVKRQPLYNSMIALNAEGVIMASTSGSSGGKRADRDYFKAAMEGRFFISAPSTSQQTGTTAVFISIPVGLRTPPRLSVCSWSPCRLRR